MSERKSEGLINDCSNDRFLVGALNGKSLLRSLDDGLRDHLENGTCVRSPCGL